MTSARTRAAAMLGLAALVSACSGSGTPSSGAPGASALADVEAVFRDFNDAISTGDAAAAAALVADDAEFFGQSAADVGIDGVVESVACAAEIKSVDVEGDSAAVELEFTGRAPLATAGDCPVGTTRTARVTVRDGKIVELTDAE